MQRVIYCGVAAAMLVALVAAPIHSQGQRQRVQVSRQGGGSGGGGGSWGGGGGVITDANTARQMRAEMHARIEQMQRQAEENRNKAIRQMLNATNEQWQRIKPQLDRIQQLDAQARVSAGPGSSGGAGTGNSQGGTFSVPGGGGSWGAGSGGSASGSGNWGGGGGNGGMGSFGPSKPPGQSQTSGSRDAQVLCNQLLRDLQTPGTPPEDIAQRVAELRKIRAQALEELTRVRKDLRALITPQQEPALIVMGYLD